MTFSNKRPLRSSGRTLSELRRPIPILPGVTPGRTNNDIALNYRENTALCYDGTPLSGSVTAWRLFSRCHQLGIMLHLCRDESGSLQAGFRARGTASPL